MLIGLLPAQRWWLVGRRSEESQRVPGWSGWRGGLGPARSGAGGWSSRGEEGWSDKEQGDGEAKGGRRNAAFLSLSLSLSSLQHAHTPKARVTQIIGRERVFTFTRSATGGGWGSSPPTLLQAANERLQRGVQATNGSGSSRRLARANKCNSSYPIGIITVWKEWWRASLLKDRPSVA